MRFIASMLKCKSYVMLNLCYIVNVLDKGQGVKRSNYNEYVYNSSKI